MSHLDELSSIGVDASVLDATVLLIGLAILGLLQSAPASARRRPS